ncbi:hypothetical protein QLH51_02875 [Sphingomonas sp. 2R-10]|uniref:hypothetical protein n=1 Tax=Sphingomonas sp. 2R-10 TaxID=3045148 RepID=UPI000F794F28|nr:hypothetical protein [Sphingomonas sp. 2R-10]MDJ0275748.1 hypothetical protein [Sphingomonas sp. 2R-10]
MIHPVLYQSRLFVAAAAAAIACACTADSGATAAADTSAACKVLPPADLGRRPLRWLGACSNGLAQGLGVLRLGERAPYQFFLGRVADGRPVQGLLRAEDTQLMTAYRFDRALKVVQPDGLRPNETAAVFRTGTAGANATAQRFEAAGNRGSAAYYARMAREIAGSEPGG